MKKIPLGLFLYIFDVSRCWFDRTAARSDFPMTHKWDELRTSDATAFRTSDREYTFILKVTRVQQTIYISAVLSAPATNWIKNAMERGEV